MMSHWGVIKLYFNRGADMCYRVYTGQNGEIE